MWSLREPALFTHLEPARSVLIAGAGGGFDVYAGLPLAFALAAAGKQVHLANLTFTDLGDLGQADWIEPRLAAVTAESTGGETYFPERTLARWLTGGPLTPVVYALERAGVQPMRANYRTLVQRLELDAIVLVDGGTDILMQGDEAGLGTPAEDMASLVAVAGIDVPVRFVVSAGFGVDSFHGICHSHVLENIATLDKAGAYLGALSISWQSPEGAAYLDAVAHAALHTPKYPSIVNGQIAAAIKGEFGDMHFTTRTGGSELFINPLMAMYFSFDLLGVYRKLLYRTALEPTVTRIQVGAAIERFRESITIRPRRDFPH
ncbi:DUF1152 domain-containing protein [Catelliglobosispora koreensis]|uniref:DUF1152 domain-containing protein n=1 Tax=Catelliglobosispora koreensis TaxID=129052 RepID=UPI000372F5B5|nr:DUF1152 domain-containing protein [Catelliglobosispora koreensis]